MTDTLTFLDDLPTISREMGERTSKYVEKVLPLRDNVDKWGLIEGPIRSAYNASNLLNSGRVKGVDPTEYEFAARTLDADRAAQAKLPVPVMVTETDDDGNETEVEANTYLFGRYLSEESRTEVAAKRAVRAEASAKAKATKAAKAETNGSQDATSSDVKAPKPATAGRRGR